MAGKPKLIYCSWSKWKMEEWEVARHFEYETGVTIDSLIEFEFRNVPTHEPLLRDLEDMVRQKALSAYKATLAPSVVEHAGLILDGPEDANYPGGLTQPMWDALGAEKFVASCSVLSKRAIARAVIGYCDGAELRTFVGETQGTLRANPAGSRAFYWDPVFCPDGFDGKTYAEIADGDLSAKLQVSQSIKALRKLVEYRIRHSPILFPGL
jgi:inosine/xanthosine triphosphate pyrophosphatase family protein